MNQPVTWDRLTPSTSALRGRLLEVPLSRCGRRAGALAVASLLQTLAM